MFWLYNCHFLTTFALTIILLGLYIHGFLITFPCGRWKFSRAVKTKIASLIQPFKLTSSFSASYYYIITPLSSFYAWDYIVLSIIIFSCFKFQHAFTVIIFLWLELLHYYSIIFLCPRFLHYFTIIIFLCLKLWHLFYASNYYIILPKFYFSNDITLSF